MEQKKCVICKKEKELLEFNKNKRKKDGLNNVCRECNKIASNKYYINNKEKAKKYALERAKTVRKETRKLYFNLLKNSECVDCGNNNPLVLEFDHKDGVDKYNTIGTLVGNGTTWKNIKKEIDKCDIRCANCHRIRTAKQLNWYQDLL